MSETRMKISKDTQNKLQEFQVAEYNLQNLSLQKQAFQIELNETNSALEELKESDGEAYKIIGNIMIKTEKPKILKELEEKKEILNLRLKTIENQERIIAEKIERLRKEIENELKSEKN